MIFLKVLEYKFLLFPVYNNNRNYGCILVDYFGKNRNISEEEAELMTLLSINTAIRLENKTMEEAKIDYERTATLAILDIDSLVEGKFP